MTGNEQALHVPNGTEDLGRESVVCTGIDAIVATVLCSSVCIALSPHRYRHVRGAVSTTLILSLEERKARVTPGVSSLLVSAKSSLGEFIQHPSEPPCLAVERINSRTATVGKGTLLHLLPSWQWQRDM